MAETDNRENIVFGDVLTATVKVSNDNESDRQYRINANAAMEGSRASSLTNGEVRRIDGDTVVAQFVYYSQSYLNLTYNKLDSLDDNEAALILEKVMSFVKEVSDKAATIGSTAEAISL